MSRWTKDVLKWIRPHHFIKALIDPQRAVRELKYRYTFTSKSRFLADILSVSEDLVLEKLDELKESRFRNRIEQKLSKYPIKPGRGPMGQEAEALYAAVRMTKPLKIVETGVGAGFSTAFLLEALRINANGTLFSIDLFDNDDRCGWVIPENLKNRWELIRGRSVDVLQPLVDNLKSFDIFIHDSDHSAENMMAEFRTVWPNVRTGGIFFAHDIGRNGAFFRFLKEANFNWRKVRTYPFLAGLRKTEK